MTDNVLSKSELADLAAIAGRYYMAPPLAEFDAFVKNKDDKTAFAAAFDHIHDFMVAGKPKVEKILEERLERKEIKDVSQARKAIAGAMFSSMVELIFLKNKAVGNISAQVFITHKRAALKRFGESFVVRVAQETQMPDCDLVIYNEDNGKFIILSLKTSLRERAGQTYKWKLLLDIAQSDHSLKEKYDIRYEGKNPPLMCFATVNFYNEINNPQQRGMFKFFNRAFIAKPGIESDFIRNLSELPAFIRETIA